MAPALSKLSKSVTVKNVVLLASLGVSVVATLRAVTWSKRNAHKNKKQYSNLPMHDDKTKKSKAAVDYTFFRNLLRILKILVPGKFTKETMYMVIIAASLVSRTYCDVWMISKTTGIERTIISKDVRAFKKEILTFFTAFPIISIVNQVLKYGISELKLHFRTRLTLKMQEEYLEGMTYYKMNNLDTRVANPDQLLTQDLDRFCDSIVEFYSNVTKPILDIVLYVKTLISTASVKTPLAMIELILHVVNLTLNRDRFNTIPSLCKIDHHTQEKHSTRGYLVISGSFLIRLRKPVSRMTSEEQRLEGEFRYVNSRLIANSEEIAFYQGQDREKKTMSEYFQRLVDHLRDLNNFKFSVGIVDNMIAKYLATVVGFCSVALSFFAKDNRHENMNHLEIMEDYYTTGRIVLRMAEALGRLSLAFREMTKLSGYTSRVILLIDVLKDMKRNKYVRSQVKQEADEVVAPLGKTVDMTVCADFTEKDHVICFENVPLVTPNGDILIRELNFEVVAGRNVLVCGPNGCGKSSLFRVLGELWPAYGGSVTKPHCGKLFYVPQRPYMTIGTLRDQLIYPDSYGAMRRKGTSDHDLKEMLDKVHLGYILEREGGWDSVQDWIDVLSGGEKQRVAMARLFYHSPQFAILDECTSAVSVDVEGYMYTHCKEVGITLFTVSHRKSLWKYHEYVLYMDGKGSYEYKPIDSSTTEFGS